MSEPAPIAPAVTRRAQLGAAALVALVVVVLGFGAGIGAVFERDGDDGGGGAASAAVTPGSTPTGGRVDASVTPGSVPTSTGPGRRLTGAPAVGRAPAGAGDGTGGQGAATSTVPTSTSTTAPAAPSTSPSTTPPAAANCPGLVTAMVNPFWDHFEAAHLETSVGQQVADAMNTDDYALAHLALIQAILEPLIDLVFDVDGTSPLWTHLRAAHLESSPGQQIADLLNLDDYLLAHTVLVDDMLVSGSGQC